MARIWQFSFTIYQWPRLIDVDLAEEELACYTMLLVFGMDS
jgi:hypothetical protein